jgi:UDP-glucose 4-epimerase
VTGLADGRALVTGASGFIGSHLTRRLVAEGAEVHAVTSRVSAEWPMRLTDLRGRIALHHANVADRHALDRLARAVRPTHVFHLAAFTHVAMSWLRVDECVTTNVQGTANLLHALDGVGYERLVHVGTSEIYGAIEPPYREDAVVNPVSPYGVTKEAGERLAWVCQAAYGWPLVFVRPFNAYGPGQTPDRLVPELVVRGLLRLPLAMTEGHQTRELNYVEDLVDGLVLAATTPDVEGELFNLGSGDERSVREVATLVLDLLGNPVTPEFGALPERPNEIVRMVSDSTRARDRLGWKPQQSLEEGLAATVAWYREELSRPGSPFGL